MRFDAPDESLSSSAYHILIIFGKILMDGASISFCWIPDSGASREKESGAQKHQTSTESVLNGESTQISVFVILCDRVMAQKLNRPLRQSTETLRLRMIRLKLNIF